MKPTTTTHDRTQPASAVSVTAPVDFPEEFLRFHCPLDAEVNPHLETLVAESVRFARKFDLGVGDDQATCSYGQTGAVMVSCAFPHLRAVAQPGVDFSAWGFLANDLVLPADPEKISMRDAMEMVGRWCAILSTPELCGPDHALIDRALGDSILRLRRACPDPFAYRQFVTAQIRWLNSMQWEAALRSRGAVLGIGEYLAMRIGAVGVYASEAYLSLEAPVDTRVWAGRLGSAAIECGLLTAALDNDRYSLHKESAPGQREYNLFDAIQVDRPDLPRSKALIAGVELRDALLTRYLQLRGELLDSGDESLMFLATRIDRVIAGGMNLAMTALRYQIPGTQITVLPAAPPEPSDVPMYPVTSWWWDTDIAPHHNAQGSD